MLPDRDATIENDFPTIYQCGYKITSPQTKSYNCIAWAAGDIKKWWWPHPMAYWPPGVERTQTIAAFVKAYNTVGFDVCDNAEYEEDYDKIVIYVDMYNRPLHAAIQVNAIVWSSKIGGNHDIEHTLEGVTGNVYGNPAIFLKRRKI